MLHTRRDQENRVHDHRHASKQLQKTTGPGAKEFTKTPLKVPLNDENAALSLGGKSFRAISTRHGANEKFTTVEGKNWSQAGRTPMLQQSRAPLGNKTTNAKSQIRSTGGQSIAKSQHQSQVKPVSLRRPTRCSSSNGSQLKFTVKSDASRSKDEDADEEPEFAPLNPEPLPYLSDILPRQGLTFEGLKPDNMFLHSHELDDPVDSRGMRRSEGKLAQELEDATKRLAESFESDSRQLEWNITGRDHDNVQTRGKMGKVQHQIGQHVRHNRDQMASNASGRKAAASLASLPDRKASVGKPQPAGSQSRSIRAHSRSSSTTNIAGEMASRTTLGYNKGKAASTIVHNRSLGAPRQPVSKTFTLNEDPLEDDEDLKIEIPEDDAGLPSLGSSGYF